MCLTLSYQFMRGGFYKLCFSCVKFYNIMTLPYNNKYSLAAPQFKPLGWLNWKLVSFRKNDLPSTVHWAEYLNYANFTLGLQPHWVAEAAAESGAEKAALCT